MSIDKNIYNNGIKGLLSYWEIDSLPKDYEIFKGMFKEATDIKQGKRVYFSQDKYHIYEPACHKPMSKFRKELRAMQVISRATYGVNAFAGNKPGTVLIHDKTWLGKFLFWANPVRLWRMFSLYWNLRKKWAKDEKEYSKAKKKYKKTLKEYKKKYNSENIQYNMDNHEWTYRGTC